MQVTFCKRATNYRALLRKRTYKDKASLPPRIGLFSRIDFEMLKGRHNVKEQFVVRIKTQNVFLLIIYLSAQLAKPFVDI